MGLTTADYQAVYREVLKGPIIDLIPRKRILLRYIKEGPTDRFHGDLVEIPLHTQPNEGFGFRRESADLPTPKRQTHDRAKYNMAYFYVGIELTGPVMAGSSTRIGAVADALVTEQEGAMEDALDWMNHRLWSNGTGILTQAKAGGPSTTVNVESVKYIRVGMSVDILDMSDGTVLAADQEVTAVDRTANTFVIATSVTTTTAHGVYRAGERVAATWGDPRIAWGLDALVDDESASLETTHGITSPGSLPGQLDRDTEEAYRSTVIDHGAAALDEDVLDRAFDEADIASDGRPGIVLTNHKGVRTYKALLQSQRRFVNVMTLRGGWKGAEFNGVGMFADKDVHVPETPQQSMYYFLDFSAFNYYTLLDWDWITGDGGGILHWKTGKDVFEGYLKCYKNYTVANPRRQVKLANVLELNTA